MKIPFPKYNEELVVLIEEYLDQNYATEVQRAYPMGDPDDGLEATIATGAPMGNYLRPMFELIAPTTHSGSLQPVRPSCAECDNFAVTWTCDQHPEGGGDLPRSPTPAHLHGETAHRYINIELN